VVDSAAAPAAVAAAGSATAGKLLIQQVSGRAAIKRWRPFFFAFGTSLVNEAGGMIRMQRPVELFQQLFAGRGVP
jgi:hypothetical protein